jgi:hypothetical protein
MISLMKAAEQLGICMGSSGLSGKLKTSSSSHSRTWDVRLFSLDALDARGWTG